MLTKQLCPSHEHYPAEESPGILQIVERTENVQGGGGDAPQNFFPKQLRRVTICTAAPLPFTGASNFARKCGNVYHLKSAFKPI